MPTTLPRPITFDRPLTARERQIIEDITRREFVVGGATLAALIAAGCSGDDAPSAEGDDSRATFRYTDAAGRQVEIPVRPSRIVSLHEATSGAALLSVGAPIVGMVLDDSLPERPYDLTNIEGVGSFAEPNFEAIAALRPDLIVAYAAGGQVFPEDVGLDALEAIAPTVAFAEDIPIEEYMAAVAAVSGRADEVARQRTAYLEELDALRAAVPAAPQLTVAVVDATDSEFSVFKPTHSAAAVAIPLAIGALPAPLALAETDGAFDELYVTRSTERVEELRADVILYNSFGETITRSPLWRELPAVRAGQAHVVPTLYGASYANYSRTISALREILPGAIPLGL